MHIPLCKPAALCTRHQMPSQESLPCYCTMRCDQRPDSTSQHWHTVESALLKISMFFSLSQYKTVPISTQNTSSLRVRIWSGNKGDCPGSRAPVWCVGRRRPAVTGSRSAPPHPHLEPSPHTGAKPRGRSRGSSSPSCFGRTCKSEAAMKPKRSTCTKCH